MPAPDLPVEYTLDDDERAELVAIAQKLIGDGDDATAAEFYDRSWPVAEQLPANLRHFLADFRRREPASACLVHGFPVDDAEIGPTPPHWESAMVDRAAAPQEVYLALCGMALGEPFAWATLQSGRIIQNILPIAGDEKRQSGHGSQTLLEFHTEDGFHSRRCDYLLLLGLRNHDRVPTLLASVRDLELDEDIREVLTQPRFYIFPDTEHVRQLTARDPDHPALREMRRMLDTPEPAPVLFGDRVSPYLRIDRPFMRCVDATAERALDALMVELERVTLEVVVGPGTLLVVDNYLAVHGRRAFQVRYDGTDRWLKKLTVSRNLRRGLVDSEHPSRRVLF